MVVELVVASVAGSLTVITVAGLRFAKWAISQESQALADPGEDEVERKERRALRREAILEQKRILERDRSEWVPLLNKEMSAQARLQATKVIKEIDDKLMALAEELKRL